MQLIQEMLKWNYSDSIAANLQQSINFEHTFFSFWHYFIIGVVKNVPMEKENKIKYVHIISEKPNALVHRNVTSKASCHC